MHSLMLRLIPVYFFFCLSCAHSSERLITDDFIEIGLKAETLGNKFSPENVLLVFDIDDTILSMNQDLGSEAWFNWQDEMIQSKAEHDGKVASDFASLLKVNGKIFALSATHATQINAPYMIQRLQKLGFRTLVLTSRDATYFNSTQRELENNGYVFGAHTIGPDGGYSAEFLPYDLSRPASSPIQGLTEKEMKALKLPSPRLTRLQHGVYFTSGQHKGAMLRSLLARTQYQPKAVIFVDNVDKHIDRMHQAFDESRKDIYLVTYRFNKMDSEIERFKKSDKKAVTQDWLELKAVLDRVFP